MTHRFIEGMLSKIGKDKISTASLDAANVTNLQTKSKEELAKIVDAQSNLLIAQKQKIEDLDSQIKELTDLVNRQNAVLKQQAAVIQTLKAKSGSKPQKAQKVLAVAPVAPASRAVPKAVPKAPAPAQRALPSKADTDTGTGSVLDRKASEAESSTAAFLRKLFG